jgi:serine/threonine protein phosphatase PrpC
MAHIQVIEGLSIPGTVGKENDDALGSTGSIAFVLDGATGLGDAPLMAGASDAAWVARAAREFLLRRGEGHDLRRILTEVGQGILTRFEAERLRAPQARYEWPWATVSLIGVEAGRLNIAYVGDSRILIETAGDEVHNFGINPSRTAFETRIAAKMIAARKGEALGIESIRATVLADLRRARDTVNTPNGFWMLGADPAVGANATVTSIALDGPATVLLATDGFYALVEDYKRYGDRELIATAQTMGLAILARELRRIEDDDPNGVRYPRMKKSDDATALLVRVEP